MDYSSEKLFSRKNIFAFLALLILVIAIPIAVMLAQRQQQFKSKAASEPDISFLGTDVKVGSDGIPTTTSPTVTIKVTSPFGLSKEK